MKPKINVKRAIRDYTAITIGSFVMAVGIGVFLVGARVVPGGVSGLSMAIHYLSGNQIPIGLMIWIFNIPLFIWGLKVLGNRFGVRTFIGFTLSSFFIDMVRGSIPGLRHIRWHESPSIVDMVQNDFLIAVIFGGVLLGIGLGTIFKFRGSTGGSDIVAAIIQKKHGWKPGQAIMLIDFFVIILAGIIIHTMGLSPDKPALTLTLYAFALLFVASRIIDTILDGFDYAKSALIISKKPREVTAVIMERLSRGATILYGRGLYSESDKEIIYTVITRKEITLLTDIIKEIDPDAFITINNVHEVLGKGFRPRV